MEHKTLSVLEHTHIAEMQKDLSRKLSESTKQDVGGGRDELRREILRLVVSESYDHAKERLADYVSNRTEFPAFQERAYRYIQHCSELIQAIQTKRNFPGLASLSLSRQQEIHEKVVEHFEELKQNLRHILKIERDHVLVDVRSTVWVLKALSVTVFAVVTVAFLMDLQSGVLSSLIYTVNHWAESASDWIVRKVM